MALYTALVTLLVVGFHFYTGLRVGQARGRYGVMAPATTGHPDFERALRVQMNTLEWMPIVLPSMWLFAIYASDAVGAVLGLAWIAGRVLYLRGYMQAAEKRGTGFAVQAVAASVMWVGALFAIASRLLHGG